MRVLFVPVSAARGFGEYARAREIALALKRRRPDVQIHFVLSAEAPYASACPFPATLLPGSATLHTAQVITLLRSFKPDVVIFDNAGRTAQVRAAHAGGARVVYVSSRRRQRGRAFRPSWMRCLSEHWIAYPSFIAGDLGWLERLKLRLLGRPRVRFVDTVLPVAAFVGDCGPGDTGDFVLVVPGGGTGHPGAPRAPQAIAAAAAALASRGIRTLLVGVTDATAAGATDALLTRLPLLPQPQLIDLLRRARVVLTNGGDTLLQALACSGACVAVPIAHDQAARIARCRRLGLIAEAPLASAAMADAVSGLFADEARRTALIARGRAIGVTDAMPQIMEWLTALMADPAPR